MLGRSLWGEAGASGNSLGRKMLAAGIVALVALIIAPSAAMAAGADVLFWTTKTPRPPAPVPLSVREVAEEVGNQVYLFGGATNSGNSTLVNGVAVYNTSSDTWGTTVNMSIPTYAARSVADSQGNIWIFGGINSPNGLPGTNVLKFSTTSQSFSSQSALPGPRARSSACVIGNTAYLVGGDDGTGQLNSIVAVDLTTGNSNVVAGATMPVAVQAADVFSYNNMVYCFGGINSGVTLTQGWKWDPNNPTVFTPLTSAPLPVAGGRGHAMGNGKIYTPATGGNGSLTLEYDIVNDTWYVSPAMPHPRSGASMALSNNTINVIGGWDSGGNALAYNDQAQIVPATGSSNANVVAGQTSQVSVGGNQVSVAFPGGSTPGTVTVSTIPTTSIPPGAGVGFRLWGTLYDIATSSTGWGTLTVTLPYGGTNPSPIVRHWDGTIWEPITLPTNSQYNSNYGTILSVVTGPGGSVTFTTPSLSPFGLEDPLPAAATSTPADSGWSLALLAIAGCLGMLVYRRRQTA